MHSTLKKTTQVIIFFFQTGFSKVMLNKFLVGSGALKIGGKDTRQRGTSASPRLLWLS